MLSFESPRFTLHFSCLSSVDAALASVGHVVIDALWNTEFLAALHGHAAARYERDDARFAAGFDAHADSVVEGYLAGVVGLDSLFDGADAVESSRAWDRRFFSEVELSGLPGLLRVLLSGDFFVGRSERVIRRGDPRFPVRFIGLHPDGQLHLCSEHGLNTKRELTIWTPLQDCANDHTPRLLLMHKGETYTELFESGEDGRAPAVERRRRQIRNEAEVGAALRSEIERGYERLFQERRCYAPYVPFGSAIIFEAGVFHASYYASGMTTPRFSMDFRAVGDFKRTADNMGYVGNTYRVAPVLPIAAPADNLPVRAPNGALRTFRHSLSRALSRRRRVPSSADRGDA